MTAAGVAPRLSLRGVSKSFPGVRALADVSLELAPGEIHALVGENGAGKSTLMKIIAGVESPDEGAIALDGRPLEALDERAAVAAGIGMVHQERSLVPTLSVAENVFAGRQPLRRTRLGIDWRAMRAATRALFDQLQSDIDPGATVGALSPAEQQMVEIAKALSHDLGVLILDEPTAALSLAETRHLFAVTRRLASAGTAVVYISHRLAEVFELSDTVTVLKDGRRTGGGPTADFTEAELIRLMVGRELTLERAAGRHEHAIGDEPVLRVSHLAAPPKVVDASLDVHAGEIVCLAGLIGAGRTELCESIFGARGVSAGTIELAGRPHAPRSPADARAAAVGMVPEDRKDSGLFLGMSIAENVAAANLGAVSPRGVVRRGEVRALAETYVKRLRIVTPGVDQSVGNLSGGNQQKVLLAKWLANRPKLLIVDEPTRGVDVGARSDIYAVLRELADSGIALLVVSSDLPEVLTLADRVVVMAEGRVTGEVAGDDADEETILRLASPGATTAEVIA
ncbi:sugar ABC transporter ATP-binding protein [Baekduia sp.]|uniref:sugar ABC transporter ATP-binding protein n=1 Tax=Baekduia sp. TaxID=2600305 RepID=UPI002D784295|nr:sugar ABC transporter ATP-binding protein [Baekduia sp.]